MLRMNASAKTPVTILAGFVNWNQKEDSLECLKKLSESCESGIQLHLAVVDNASTDGTPESIRQNFPEVKLIANSSNRGAAGGRNDLFQYFLNTRARYLMILDPDVSIIPPFFIPLVEEIEISSGRGCVGVKAYYADQPDTFWARGGGKYNPWLGCFYKTGQKEKDTGQYREPEEIDSIPAGFTFVKREVIEKVPRMDERYFIYFEESDWNFKIKKKGYTLWTSAQAKVLHKVSSSLGMESPYFYYYRTRNNLLFVFRNSPFYCWPVFLVYFFAWNVPNTLYMLWRNDKSAQLKAVLRGLFDFLRGRFYQCPYRF